MSFGASFKTGPSFGLGVGRPRPGRMPVIFNDFARYGFSDRITFSRDSDVNGFVDGPVLNTFATDEPAFVIDPATLQRLGYRALAGFTNSLLWSRDLSNGVWGSTLGAAGFTQNETGMDGAENTAWTVTDDDPSGFEDREQDVTIPDDSNPNTVVFPFKKTDSATTFPGLRIRFQGGSSELTFNYTADTDNGTLVKRGIGNTADAVRVLDGGAYWLFAITMSNNGTGNTTVACAMLPAVNTDASDTWDDTVTGSIVYDFGGVYLNSIAGPPIETEGSPVSTAADDATEPLPASCQDGFVIFVTARVADPLNFGQNAYLFDISDGTTSNRVGVYSGSGASSLTFFSTVDGTNDDTTIKTGLAGGSTVKIAVAVRDGEYRAVATGGAVNTLTLTGFPSGLDTTYIGQRLTKNQHWNSTIADYSIRGDPEKWTDSDLEAWVNS